jgi:zinc/manganese transport system substrate-binding protein
MMRWLVAALVAVVSVPAFAQGKVNVATSFTILADFARNVGGDRVEVVSLVGPNGDAHSYVPSPADAKKLADAKLVILNGLGLEGSTERFMRAAAKNAKVIVASDGIAPLRLGNDPDPHAWQSVANAKIYVASVRDALIAVDPAGKSTFEANAAAYLIRLDALDAEVTAEIAKIPPDRRKLVTTHDAFGYFGSAYGIAFIAPHGVSTEAQASASRCCAHHRADPRQKIPAVFLERTDPRLLERIARVRRARRRHALLGCADRAERPGADSINDAPQCAGAGGGAEVS